MTVHLCLAVHGLSRAVAVERSLQAPVRERLLPIVSSLAERLRPAVRRQLSRGLLPEAARIDRDGLIAMTWSEWTSLCDVIDYDAERDVGRCDWAACGKYGADMASSERPTQAMQQCSR